MSIDRSLWSPEGVYLDSATYGLPPAPAWDAFQAVLESWHDGTGRWEEWIEAVEQARGTFARLVHVPPARVAVGATVSELIGLVAAALAGSRVLTAEGDFSSLTYPFAVHGDPAAVPLDRLIDASAGYDVVAVSAVQSSSGVVADLDALAGLDTLTVVDATQACGWLPLDAGRFDAVACAAYKWLLAPRGVAFLAVGDRLAERLEPLHAGWFAGDDVHASYYGLPPRLASSARRLDSSPAWFSWVGAAESLAVLEAAGIGAIHEHDVGLANRFREGFGLEPSNSAIVSLSAERADERLRKGGIKAATREGGARLAFHLYNTEADVDAALAALAA